ncbi:MAG: DUF4398 domain-containing protein [Elusimicrobia bacterium]|nr:DUF4398 domain-containing protein [Elusimicrobiota bacterium]
MLKKSSFFYGLVAAGLMISGCAKPPTLEIADAENAVNAAAQDGAADFAPSEFNNAKSALDDARAKMAAKDYAAARAGAMDAKAKAEMAQGAIAAGKEAAKGAAAEAIASVEAKLKELKAKSAKMTGKAGAEIKSGIKAIESEWTKVVEDNMNGNYTKVTSAASDIGAKIDALAMKNVAPAKPTMDKPVAKGKSKKK